MCLDDITVNIQILWIDESSFNFVDFSFNGGSFRFWSFRCWKWFLCEVGLHSVNYIAAACKRPHGYGWACSRSLVVEPWNCSEAVVGSIPAASKIFCEFLWDHWLKVLIAVASIIGFSLYSNFQIRKRGWISWLRQNVHISLRKHHLRQH